MRIFILAAFILFVSFGTPFFAGAETDEQILIGADTNQLLIGAENPNNTGDRVTLLNPLKGVDCSRSNGNCLSAFLLNILDFVITIGSIVVILMLVYVGFKFVTAQGKPGEIDAAKQMLLWTIIGALILLGSKAIALGVEATVRSLGG